MILAVIAIGAVLAFVSVVRYGFSARDDPATFEDIKVGDRVVLTVAESGDQMTAREVLLASDPATPKKD